MRELTTCFFTTMSCIYVLTRDGCNGSFSCTKSEVREDIGVIIYCFFDGELSVNETVKWSQFDSFIGKCVYDDCPRKKYCWNCTVHGSHRKIFAVSFCGLPPCFALTVRHKLSSNESREILYKKYYISLNSGDKVLAFGKSDNGRLLTEMKTFMIVIFQQ